jgi:hypothetical protein
MPGRSDAFCTNSMRSHVWQKDNAHFYVCPFIGHKCPLDRHTKNARCLFDTRTVAILFVPSVSELNISCDDNAALQFRASKLRFL